MKPSRKRYAVVGIGSRSSMRWHRRRENSGSLLVHKATHHFDLVNWWLGAWPTEVFGMGRSRSPTWWTNRC